jgi:hypothetical protein
MTTATTWRKERGRETERLLAAYWRERGWPYAEPVGAGRPGADITGMPGLAVEAKATTGCHPAVWLRQARAHANGSEAVPFTVWRPDGSGPAHIEQWPVVVDLSTFTRLLRAAGYGDGDDS